MGRLIGGVVVGYLTMFVLVFGSFTAAYLAMGANSAFQAGSYEPSTLWLVVSWVLGFLAAVAGGCVCMAIARTPKGPLTLCIVVVVLGVLFAIPTLMGGPDERPTVRTGDVANMDAMMNARQPAWLMVLNPILGAVGVMVGGRLKGA
ncbi:MAG: hypothetical protein ACREAA_11060 [Candidatus Polarisedimenticolia bacterium]